LALIVLSVVEQRLDAVRAVLAGAEVTEVAARIGVHRTTVTRWVARYLSEQIGGLQDRSHRPKSCPHQVDAVVEVAVAEMRREHPRWGSRRIRLELLREPLPWQDVLIEVPSERTIDRILLRQGLVRQRPRKKPRSAWKMFERPAPMQLWGIDIVGGIQLVNTATGEIREAKLVTGVDDHSRFCVMAAVVERATARAVCLAFAAALAKHGVPEEVITDNGKQFTDRFSRYGPKRGEVLFDKICRLNGITHRLTQPASPNQNGKVERFHGTFRPDFLAGASPFESLEAAQAAVDGWVDEYNRERPHQALDERVPVVPADRFEPAVDPAVEVWVPPTFDVVSNSSPEAGGYVFGSGAPIELSKPVPASGNMTVAFQQVWMGPDRVGQVVRFWVDCDWLHASIGDQRVKTVRSKLSPADLDRLVASDGAVAATTDPPISTRKRDRDGVVEVERTVARAGTVALGSRVLVAAEILAGRRVGIRIEDGLPLMFFDPETRELLRTRPNPFKPGEAYKLQRPIPVGPMPRPRTEPITVQRRASNSGIVQVVGQKVALGRQWTHHTVTIHVSETTLAIELPDGETMTVGRTTDQPVRSIKGQRPRTANNNSIS
jgi:transposase InsO family protein